jgi:Leucine-rich repeat (LRR) protein
LKGLRNQDITFLTSVPAALGGLGALEELNLSDNQLTSVPAALGGLGALEELERSTGFNVHSPALQYRHSLRSCSLKLFISITKNALMAPTAPPVT